MRLFWMAGVQGGLLGPPDLSCGAAGGGFKRRSGAEAQEHKKAKTGRAFRGPQSLNEAGKPGKGLTPLRQHRFSSARTPFAVFQANLPYPDSNFHRGKPSA